MSENSRAAAAAAAVICIVGAGSALAADLYGQDSPYADPRTSETYRHPVPPPPRYAQPYPNDTYQPPYRGYQQERGYLAPMPGPPAYGRDFSDQGYPRCVPRELIHEQLRRQGWHSVEELGAEDRFVFARVRDWRGAAFDLRLDRCNGRVLETRLVEPYPSDYAWRQRRGYRSY
jgi:hypothetical protein